MTLGPDEARTDGDPFGSTTSVGWPGERPGSPVRPVHPADQPPVGGSDGREPDRAPRDSGNEPLMPPGPPVRPPASDDRPTLPPPPGATPTTPAPTAPGTSMSAPTRATAPPPFAATAVTAAASSTTARKGGRRARLTVKRIDPWSTLKFSFVYSLAGLVVLVVAVIALYAVVDSMGVIDSIRNFLNDVDQPKSGQGIAVWLTFGRVLTVAIVVGIVNVILFTAFATLTAFVYNVCTELVGGIEVTLAERS